jgi:hypothetical protein
MSSNVCRDEKKHKREASSKHKWMYSPLKKGIWNKKADIAR